MTIEKVGADGEPTLGRLIADTTADVSSLVHNEIELAKSELKVSVKAGGIGAVAFGSAAFLLVLGVIMLSFSCAHFLERWFTPPIAFLIVFGVYFVGAVLLGGLGVVLIKKVKAPEKAIAEAKSTKQVLTRG
ncbi:MAG TPA: phage holin family protein [Nocardioidaceae bacterium]|nr:phage holin family protein [Nocardioidaceae bacterium]